MQKSDFHFKKIFGQNFIFDTNFLHSLLKDFDLEKSSNILEIGAGMGTLTSILAQNYKKVVSFEIDKTLTEKLRELEKTYDNLTIVLSDILKTKNAEIDEIFAGEKYSIIANIPYYITSQIVFKFMLETSNLESMFIMVQKEVGERFCAKESTRDYGIPSVILSTFGECKMLKQVPRKMFKPVPNVDSCVIKITKNEAKNNDINKVKYHKFLLGCFCMKRKTLYNNLLKMNEDKDKILNSFSKLNLQNMIRPENLPPQQFVELYKFFE